MNKTPLEIEIDNPHNGNCFFAPLQRIIRGRFDFVRAARHEKNWLMHESDWGGPIAGQRVGFDGKDGYLLEPLHGTTQAENVKKLNMRLGPERESFPLSDDARREWLWCMAQLVKHKAARVVSGEFPKDIPAPAVKAATLDPIDRLCHVIETLLGKLAPATAPARV